MELAAMQQVGGRSPQHDGGEGLVGKSEVTPQHPKGNEVQSDAHDKQRDGYHQAVLVRALIIADGVGNGQTGSTEGRIAGCHGQHHNAEDGKGAPAEDAPADDAPAAEPEPESEQVAAEAPEPEVLTTEDLYARRPRKRAAAPAVEAEVAPVEDESKGGEQ